MKDRNYLLTRQSLQVKSTCRDRRRRSEQFDVDVQILWQAQCFGHGGSLRSDFVAGAVSRDFWICGSFSEIVAGAVLCGGWSAHFVAGAVLCGPISWQVQSFWP